MAGKDLLSMGSHYFIGEFPQITHGENFAHQYFVPFFLG